MPVNRQNTASPDAGNQRQLQEMMDIFSKATGLNVVAVDLNGNAFFSSEEYSQVSFCRYIRGNIPDGCEKCRKTY